jgi:hypothetical protein
MFLYIVLQFLVYIAFFEYTIIQNILLTTGPNSDCQQSFVAPKFSGF